MSGIWNNIPGLQAALETCVDNKLTAGETAKRLTRMFGFTISRNACIGRIHRTEGLNLKEPYRGPRKPRKVYVRPIKRVTPPPKLVEPKPLGDTGRGCKFLHGEATERLFCGAPTIDLTSWCPYHTQVCFQAGSSSAVANRTYQRQSQKQADWFAGSERIINVAG